MDKHVIQKKADIAGNGDDVYRATNIRYADRTPTRHGYNPPEDQKVYEQKTLTQILGEKKLTPAEMNKREEIAQAMEREHPGMDKSKKMAIATAAAKRVAEETEQNLFDCFAEDVRPQVEQVFNLLNDENKQTMIEMIEAEEYDTVVEIVQEVLNG